MNKTKIFIAFILICCLCLAVFSMQKPVEEKEKDSVIVNIKNPEVKEYLNRLQQEDITYKKVFFLSSNAIDDLKNDYKDKVDALVLKLINKYNEKDVEGYNSIFQNVEYKVKKFDEYRKITKYSYEFIDDNTLLLNVQYDREKQEYIAVINPEELLIQELIPFEQGYFTFTGYENFETVVEDNFKQFLRYERIGLNTKSSDQYPIIPIGFEYWKLLQCDQIKVEDILIYNYYATVFVSVHVTDSGKTNISEGKHLLQIRLSRDNINIDNWVIEGIYNSDLEFEV